MGWLQHCFGRAFPSGDRRSSPSEAPAVVSRKPRCVANVPRLCHAGIRLFRHPSVAARVGGDPVGVFRHGNSLAATAGRSIAAIAGSNGTVSRRRTGPPPRGYLPRDSCGRRAFAQRHAVDGHPGGRHAPAMPAPAWTFNGRPLPFKWRGIAADAIDWANQPVALSPGMSPHCVTATSSSRRLFRWKKRPGQSC